MQNQVFLWKSMDVYGSAQFDVARTSSLQHSSTTSSKSWIWSQTSNVLRWPTHLQWWLVWFQLLPKMFVNLGKFFPHWAGSSIHRLAVLDNISLDRYLYCWFTMIYLFNMVISNSCVTLPQGIEGIPYILYTSSWITPQYVTCQSSWCEKWAIA